MPFVQHRSVQAGEVDLSMLDLDITVRKPKDDPLEFSVSVWNLSEESWSRISDGDLCRIELGWEDGASETICLGEITSTTPNFDGSDKRYEISGVDESESAVDARPRRGWSQKTWRDKAPDAIAADLAQSVGLTPRTEEIEREINGTWSVTTDKKVRRWLDELLEYAAEFTGQEWGWFADRGQLYFQPRNSETVEAPQLSYDGTLLEISDKSDEDEEVEKQLEFEAMLEPRIRKGAAVYVSVAEYEGPYRVDSYEFNSSSVTGDHLVRGDLIPIQGDYSVDL